MFRQVHSRVPAVIKFFDLPAPEALSVNVAACAESRRKAQNEKHPGDQALHQNDTLWSIMSATPSTHTTIFDTEPEGQAETYAEKEADRTHQALEELPKETSEKLPESQPPAPHAHELHFPDGGWRAWIVVVGAWCVSFVTFGFVNAFGVFQNYYQTHQLSAHTPSDISWIGSMQLFLIFFAGLFVGRYFDGGYFFGSGLKGRSLSLTGSVLYVFSIFMTSLCHTYWQFFLAQGVAFGIGLGMLFLPAVSIIGHWFRTKRALAMGLLASGSSIGGIIFPIMLQHLIPKIGYPWTVRVIAFLIMGCLVIANLTMRTRLPPRESGPFFDVTAFRDVPYMLFVVGAFLVLWGLYLPFFYLEAYAIEHGVDENLAFYLLSILNAASMFGRTLPNFVADKIGCLNVLIPCVYVSGMMVFVWLATTSAGGLIAFSIVFGFFSGAYVSLIPACIASLTPHPQLIGVRMGMGFAFVSLAALTGTPIAGALVTKAGGSYVQATCFCGVVVLAGGVVMTIGRLIRTDWKVMAKC
ncbi:hypothetical protein YB2330_000668 [Saitoella coloradoensis]